MAFAAAVCVQPALGQEATFENAPVAGQRMVPMTEAQFWSLIDQSRSDDPDQQIELLRANLAKLTPDEVVAFEATFDALMRHSYRCDLWGAAYVAMGGASDDGFEYFRLWLISRGQQTFSKVLSDPDALADIAPDDPMLLEFEAIAYVASDIWSSKTGKPTDNMPQLSAFFAPTGYGSPAGNEFSEDPQALARQYPKLWKRFGATPGQ